MKINALLENVDGSMSDESVEKIGDLYFSECGVELLVNTNQTEKLPGWSEGMNGECVALYEKGDDKKIPQYWVSLHDVSSFQVRCERYRLEGKSLFKYDDRSKAYVHVMVCHYWTKTLSDAVSSYEGF